MGLSSKCMGWTPEVLDTFCWCWESEWQSLNLDLCVHICFLFLKAKTEVWCLIPHHCQSSLTLAMEHDCTVMYLFGKLIWSWLYFIAALIWFADYEKYAPISLAYLILWNHIQLCIMWDWNLVWRWPFLTLNRTISPLRALTGLWPPFETHCKID